uniref:RNA-directed RNA polymerase n=1 Tax=Cryptotermes secundus trichomonasvirus 1 TaxID=3133527 RepID=A0AAT9JH92_9VIRU
MCLPDDYGKLSKDRELRLFPIKKSPQASFKVNCFARDLLNSTFLTYDILRNICLRGMYNDQVCAAILLAEYMVKQEIPISFVKMWVPHFYLFKDRVGEVSNWLKMFCPSDDYRVWSMAENGSLAGRDVGEPDAQKDLSHRVAPKGDNPHELKVDQQALANVIRSIFLEEMSEGSESVDSFREHVLSAVLWCKKGAHHHPLFKKYESRLEFLLNTDVEMIMRCRPEVFINQVRKLEHGKTRFIYNCDTVSYLYFDYILNWIEGHWCNKRVLLNPDYANAARLSVMKAEEYMMLDYTDFNSQHSVASMQTLFKVISEFVPRKMLGIAKWCIQSWDFMYINKNVKWNNTLPSGHRATSVVNSILNRAYMQMYFPQEQSYHCGDDSLILNPLYSPGQVMRLPFELNGAKQSSGHSGEFLRMRLLNGNVQGYVARSISTLVSGNWLSDCLKENTNSFAPFMNQINTCSCRALLKGWMPPCLYTTVARRYIAPPQCLEAILALGVFGAGLVCYGEPQYRVVPGKVELSEPSAIRMKNIEKLYRVISKKWERKMDITDLIHSIQSRRAKAGNVKVGYEWIKESPIVRYTHKSTLQIQGIVAKKYNSRSSEPKNEVIAKREWNYFGVDRASPSIIMRYRNDEEYTRCEYDKIMCQ